MDMEVEIAKVIAGYLLSKNAGEKKAKELAISYASYLKDLPLPVIAEVIKEKGLIGTPQEFRNAVINKGIIMALRELLYAIDRIPPGGGAVRFSDPKMPTFVDLMGGLGEIRKMSIREVQINLYKFYSELPFSNNDIVYDIEPGRQSYVFIDFPRRLKREVSSLKELKEVSKEMKELSGRRSLKELRSISGKS